METMIRSLVGCGVALALVGFQVRSTGTVAAQTSPPSSPPSDPASLREAVDQFRELERHVALEPHRYDLLLQAVSEGAVVGAAHPLRERRIDFLTRALRYGRRAKAADENGIGGRYWLAVVSALLAEESGGREKVVLAEQAWSESAWVLEVDSLHAGAHHVQGRLHAAVMRMNGVRRFLAQKILGADVLGRASWEKAEYHLRTAASLAPDEPVNHLELGALWRDLGLEDQARAAFLRAASAQPRHVMDHVYIDKARAHLAETHRS